MLTSEGGATGRDLVHKTLACRTINMLHDVTLQYVVLGGDGWLREWREHHPQAFCRSGIIRVHRRGIYDRVMAQREDARGAWDPTPGEERP